MRLFSQRKGFKPVKSVIQVDDMDNDLRNGLWNALTNFYWDRMKYDFIYENHAMNVVLKRLWRSYFKQAIDTLDDFWPTTHKVVRSRFYHCAWYEVYDFIEFIADNYPDKDNSINPNFMDSCNSVLKSELSAYRFVGGKIAQITSEEEIAEIEEALGASETISPVTTHLRRAMDLLTDRKSPDYRNSIKESISAVEAICRLITNNAKATLGQALNEIENKVGLHGALKSAFSRLYGYTSDEQGIRHSLLDESNLDFEDAKFMLVSCSGFINYLISKSSKAGIKL